MNEDNITKLVLNKNLGEINQFYRRLIANEKDHQYDQETKDGL